jgi:hypothetical protein
MLIILTYEVLGRKLKEGHQSAIVTSSGSKEAVSLVFPGITKMDERMCLATRRLTPKITRL